MPAPRKIDSHVHVGVLGDDPAFKQYGAISQWMRGQIVYKIMLLYARVEPDKVSDRVFTEAVLKAITTSGMDHVVCLALDPVYDTAGTRREEWSNLWVDNSFIVEQLIPASNGKILLGASVHPYDPKFKTRVKKCVNDGAVLLKWLPSAQQINLADPRVGSALEFLATAGTGGRALPLLLHCGFEGAILTLDPRTFSYDYLSWGFMDKLRNGLKSKKNKYATPDIDGVLRNLRGGVDAGATVILAHCGLPYFAPRFLGFLEHSDFPVVKRLLEESTAAPEEKGTFYADVSACVTPFRKSYFGDIRKLPEGLLLAASDFPVPVFELSADLGESLKDLEAMIVRGELDRIAVPQDNLLDVNWRELKNAFGEHAMFRNAEGVVMGGA